MAGIHWKLPKSSNAFRAARGEERRSFHTRRGLICLHCLLSLSLFLLHHSPPSSAPFSLFDSFTVVGAWQVDAKHVCATLDKPADAHIKCSLARRVRCHMFPFSDSLSLLSLPHLAFPLFPFSTLSTVKLSALISERIK